MLESLRTGLRESYRLLSSFALRTFQNPSGQSALSRRQRNGAADVSDGAGSCYFPTGLAAVLACLTVGSSRLTVSTFSPSSAAFNARFAS